MPKDPRFQPTAPRVVEVLAFPDVQLLDVAGPLQVFATANEIVAPGNTPAPYALRVVASQARVTTSAGLDLSALPLPLPDAPLDTLVVAGGRGVHGALANRALVDWVRARAAGARRVASVCTGAFLLGEAGLLDGRRVVTHWTRCAELARRFPAARVEADPIFVVDSAVWTSAGITAGIDLCLSLVEQDEGSELALAVARHLVVFLKRPGGQAQFSTTLELQAAEDQFGPLHAWIRRHLDRDLSLPTLAQRAGMSERNFSRRYAEATGLTPARAVERLRVEAARRLLAGTCWPTKRIAVRCGFGSEETFRRSFTRLLATTPQNYRTRFGLRS